MKKELARPALKVTTWSPSRYAKYKECPAKVKYEDLLKACPVCFKGRVSGGYDGEPVVCDTCSKPQPERIALDRGNVLDAALTTHLKVKDARLGIEHSDALVEALRHPAIQLLAKKLRKLKGVTTQESIVLNRSWQRVSQYTKGAWARLKLDVLHVSNRTAKVIDWKSGNINKAKGVIREKDEYQDSMRVYQISVLAAYPKVQKVAAMMVFLDAPPKLEDPTKSLPVLVRRDLKEAQATWERKIEPMMNDTIFAPRPGYYCGWCPFSKKNNGPCPH